MPKNSYKVVYKYLLRIDATNEINMPIGAQILKLDMQGVNPHLWVLCDPKKEQVLRRFYTIQTGSEIHNIEDLSHIGTYYVESMGYCGHVFEQITKVHAKTN